MIKTEKPNLGRFAIACTVGADLRVRPGLGLHATTEADTQVCPYTDSQTAQVTQKPLSGLARKLPFIIPVIIALALFGVLSEIYAQQTGADQSQAAPTPSAIAASGKAAGSGYCRRRRRGL